MSGGEGIVIAGIDLETELDRIISRYRLSVELGLSLSDTYIGTRPDLPLDSPDGIDLDQFVQHLPLSLGHTPVDIVLVRSTTDITRVTSTGLVVMIGSTALTTLLLIGLSALVARAIAQPIQRLSLVAEAVARGDLSQRVEETEWTSPFGIGNGDEIGLQITAFNRMVAELQSSHNSLETRVEARTRDLATTARVARALSTNLDVDTMLHALIQSIYEQLDLCMVALFRLESGANTAIIQETAGKVSNRLKQHEHRFPIVPRSIVGVAVETGELQVIDDVSLEPTHLRAPDFPTTGSAAAVPLLAGQDVVGVLYVQHQQPQALTPDLVNLLVTLADQIAMGLENTRLYKTEQRRRQLAELLELTGRTLSSNIDPRQVPEGLLSLLNTLVPYDQGLLLLQEGNVLRPLAHYGFPDDERVHHIEVPIHEDRIFAQIVATRKPMIVDDVMQEPGWYQISWLPLYHSWLGIPIISKDRVIGMVSLSRAEVAAFSLDDMMWVQAFAMQAGIALDNARLYSEMTCFKEQLEARTRRQSEEFDKTYRVLEQLDETKGGFIEMAACEMQTPLTTIRDHVRSLDRLLSGERDAQITSLLNGMISGIDRLRQVTESILNVTRIDTQSLKMSTSNVYLPHVIKRVRRDLKPTLDERRLTLTVSGLDTLPHIATDPDLLFKVFDRLVTNAINDTSDGGRVHVTGHVVKTNNGSAPGVEVVVSGSDIDIASEPPGRIQGVEPGSDLATVQGIVLAHGGKLWVESVGRDENRGSGSRFHVRLPIYSELNPETLLRLSKSEWYKSLMGGYKGGL
jgi:signal transduction histidine kinase